MKRKLLLLSLLVMGTLASNAQWTSQASGFSAVSRGINGFDIVDSNTVWATAYDGTGASAKVRAFTRTNSAGALWLPGTVTGTGITATQEIANISAVDYDTAYAALYPSSGTAQGIYKTVDGGATWKKLVTGFTTASFINVVHMFDASNGFAMGDPVGGYFELYLTSNNGNTWTRVPQANIPAPLSGEYGTVGYYAALDSTIWFSTNLGRTYRSTDLGMNWTVASSPIPLGTTGASIPSMSFKDQMNGLATAVNDVAAFILTTSDGGANWAILNDTNSASITNWNEVSYVPGTAGTYFITSAATVGKGSAMSTDDGMTWTYIDNVQHTSVSFANENNGWSGGFNTSSTADGIFKWGSIAVLGVNNTAKDASLLSIYPNPTKGTVNISIKSNSVDARVRVYDLLGRVVFATTATTAQSQIDLSTLAKGIYFVEVLNNGISSTQKVVVE